MRAVVVLLLLLAATVGLMLQIRADSGYVLLSYGSYSIESSLIVLLLALGLLFLALYFIIRSALAAFKLPQKARQLNQQRRRSRAANSLQQGLLEFAEGNWNQAQKRLARHADDSQLAIVHYLSAARAAQLAHDSHSRDTWLAKAYQTNPKAQVAIGITKAELQLQEGQFAQALATLRRLREKNLRHPYILKMLAQTHIRLQEWQELEQLLAELENSKAFNKEGLSQLRQQLCLNRLTQITAIALEGRREIAAEHLDSLWKKTSRQEREDFNTLLNFAKARHASGADEEAANLIESILKNDWQEEAAALYGWLNLSQNRALKVIEKWLKQYGDQPALLLTAAQVCIRYQLWGRARSWLTHLSTTRPSEAAWRELAALEESCGNTAEAAFAWRAAASMNGKTVTPLLPQNRNTAETNLGPKSLFKQPDIAGPECIGADDDGNENGLDSVDDELNKDQLELPVTPAAAYSNESKNN